MATRLLTGNWRKRVPTSRLVIYPYQIYSESARELRNRLTGQLGQRIRLIRPDGGYTPKDRSIILNWGNSNLPNWSKGLWINPPDKVAIATNKIKTFNCLANAGVIHPEWTTNKEDAQQWLNNNHTVLARTVLTGHGGEGITVIEKEQTLPTAPLYVKYKPKRKEFRVHVINQEVPLIAEKRRDRDYDNPDDKIRNHPNGWIFCYNSISEPMGLRTIAVDAVKALGLHFAAVDIIWNQRENRCYVLELNTAPGLEGQSLDTYARLFLREFCHVWLCTN